MKVIAWMDKVDATTLTTERGCEKFMGSSGALVALQGGTLLVRLLSRQAGEEDVANTWFGGRWNNVASRIHR